jgi:hypothetical protein
MADKEMRFSDYLKMVGRKVLGKDDSQEKPKKKPVPKMTKEEFVQEGKEDMARIQERLALEKQFGVRRGSK